jgi:tRNA dimethylallyltransferase
MKTVIAYLQEQLRILDPDYFEEITNPQTLQNPQRMMRFTEVCIGSENLTLLSSTRKKNSRNFTPILIGLEAERSVM